MLTGIVSMFIASKTTDYIPLNLELVKTGISHDRHSTEEIIEKEREILKTLDFDVDFFTVYDVIKSFQAYFVCNHNDEFDDTQRKLIDKITKTSKQVAFMYCYDYSLLKYK